MAASYRPTTAGGQSGLRSGTGSYHRQRCKKCQPGTGLRLCIRLYHYDDISARNLQTRHKQWYFGKSLDGFTPLGPCIVTIDEFQTPPELAIKSYVNGQLRQDSNTNLLIFDIAHVISELSQGMTLKAGTIIAMGTPAGVGMGFEPPNFLKPGDTITCEIEQIGQLTNYIQ